MEPLKVIERPEHGLWVRLNREPTLRELLEAPRYYGCTFVEERNSLVQED